MREPQIEDGRLRYGSHAFLFSDNQTYTHLYEPGSEKVQPMAKKILWALICLVFTLTGYASQLTATLQSGEKITPFYGTNAFVDAYNAAVDGDVITLSPGVFNTTGIQKGITVIGAYAFSDDSSKSTCMGSFSISDDNVTMEGIRLGGGTLTIQGADNLTVSRSYITEIQDVENDEKKYHDNTIFSDCMIIEYGAMSLSKNAVFKNCCINYFTDCNEVSYPALIENCNIPCFVLNGTTVRATPPFAIYRNCFLGLYNNQPDRSPVLNLHSPSEFHNVCFYSNYFNDSSDYHSWKFNFNSCIKDNVRTGERCWYIYHYTQSLFYSSLKSHTCDGLTVGPSDVKYYPAIPEITASEIDPQTDAEVNLHVKISAAARD